MTRREEDAIRAIVCTVAGMLMAIALFALIAIMQHSDAQDEQQLREQVAEKSRAYADLDKAGRRMVSYDRIGK